MRAHLDTPAGAAPCAWDGLRLPSCVRWQVHALPALAQAADEDLRALRARLRQRESASGRALARSLLAQCGASDGAVGRGADGAPLWPAGFIGTISHTAALLAVAVAPAHALAGIGIDVELSDGLRDTAAIDAVCLDAAERALADACALGHAQARVLFFSAKEALYKCLYPRLRRYIDFSDVAVRACDAGAGTLTLVALRPLAPGVPAGATWPATFCHAAGHVATAVVLAHQGPPQDA